MRKDSNENTNSNNQWAIGTKFVKKTQDKHDQSYQKPQQQHQPHKHIPKLKERNPFSVLKQIQNDPNVSEKSLSQEIIGLLSTLNIQQYSASEFLCFGIDIFDKRGFSNYEVLEYILNQVKVKEYFTQLSKNQTIPLLDCILLSIKNNLSYQNKDSCIKMLGHIIFEENEIDNQTLQQVYNVISKFAFEQAKQNPQNQSFTGGSGSSQSSQSKTQRLALNCLANMLLKPSPFLKQNSEMIYQKLRGIFEDQMRKIQHSYKSKRFISMLTTVIRAFQLCLNENQKLVINDNECVRLFLHCYKLLFLGSPFAEKMLNIKIQESQQKGKKTTQIIQIDVEELKSDSGSFIIDTSDLSSSDCGTPKQNKDSPSDQLNQSGDPYQKVKNYAALCLQFLFKNNYKALFNYWYLVFPSFFMKPQSEFTQYLTTFNEKQQEFFSKVSDITMREPTIFYLLKAKENNQKLKCTICYTLSIMIENQIIQKWQGQLEKEQTQAHSQTFVSMANILGQFLRFLHYQIIFMIQSENELQLLSQLIKTAGTIIHITPYSKMNKGLISTFIENFIKKIDNGDSQVKLSIINFLSIALNLNDTIQELNQGLLQKSVIENMLKGQISENLVQSGEFLQLLQRLAKNYPQKLLQMYETLLDNYFSKVFNTYDKKKIINGLKVIEEWLKNYKQQSLIQMIEDGDEEQSVQEKIKIDNQGSPFQIEQFKELLRHIVEKFLLNKNQSQSEISINVLSILSNLDQHQWKLVFDQGMTHKILQCIYQMKSPPLLKAASIKLLGYLVYFDSNTFDENFINKVYSLVIEYSNDTNLNVQIRNSWTLANLSFVKKSLNDDYLAQETLIMSANYILSTKEKVTSNGLRSLGYFFQNIDLNYFKQKILPSIQASQLQKQRLHLLREVSLDSFFQLILDNLENKSPKIAWNSCVAMANILDNQTLNKTEILFSKKSIQPLLRALEKSTNFKTKIHSAATLIKFKDFQPFANKQLFKDFWICMMNSLEQINKAIYTTNDQKYAQSLEISILQLWSQLANFQCDSEQQQLNEDTIVEFINQNSLVLLQIITEYLRKELKIPEYSGMFDKDLLQQETQQIFEENKMLETKLTALKSVVNRMRDIIKQREDVHVSFGVYEGFNSLANAEIKEYRGLDVLKGKKTSFQPSFEDSKSDDYE